MGHPGVRKKILLVDDSPAMRRMVRAMLERLEGFEFDEAVSGLDAIEHLGAGPADLMVLDMNMPDMHGLEVLRFIRSRQQLGGLRVIVLTTRGDDATRKACLDAGADAFFTKPFQPDELRQAVQDLLTKGAPRHG